MQELSQAAGANAAGEYKGEHGPFCKSKTRGKGQLTRVMIQKTEARRDKGGEGRPAKEEGKGSTEPASIRKHSKEGYTHTLSLGWKRGIQTNTFVSVSKIITTIFIDYLQ